MGGASARPLVLLPTPRQHHMVRVFTARKPINVLHTEIRIVKVLGPSVITMIIVVVVVVGHPLNKSTSSRNHSSCVTHTHTHTHTHTPPPACLPATACLPACICVMNMHMSECGACMHQCRAWCLRELFVLAESILNGGPRP